MAVVAEEELLQQLGADNSAHSCPSNAAT